MIETILSILFFIGMGAICTVITMVNFGKYDDRK